MGALAWLTNLDFAAGAAAVEEVASGGGGRPMPSRGLPPAGKPKRKKLTLTRKREAEETPPAPPAPAKVDPVVDLAAVRDAIGELSKDEPPSMSLADILDFVPRTPEPSPDAPLSKKDVQDEALRVVFPILRGLQADVDRLKQRLNDAENEAEQAKLMAFLEAEQSREKKLLLLLLQLLVLLNE